MSDKQVQSYFQALQRQIAALQPENGVVWQEMNTALEELHLMYEEMQTRLEVATIVEEELLQQTQQLANEYYRYQNLFELLQQQPRALAKPSVGKNASESRSGV
jgi:hypothetical protein